MKRIANNMRRHILNMVHAAGSGHPGGSLSATEILTALYFDVLQVDPENPQDPKRDRFVLSKGHAAPALYAALSERGFFPQDELVSLRKLGSRLQGHPEMLKTPGLDASTGSLGQGLSFACGLALGARLSGHPFRVWALLGDGECQEGQIWEASMLASHYRLSNLAVFIDANHLQIDGTCEEVMNPYPMEDKWSAFGWDALSIDGHDFDQIFAACDKAMVSKDRPTAIVARTVKGKGVSFMQNEAGWHGKAPDSEQLRRALDELEGVRHNG